MLTFAYYVLKVMICSGILYGYYLVALRNKVFHRWNRFYLLAIVIISLAAPLIKINIWQNEGNASTQAIQMLQVVNSGDEFVYEYTKNTGSFHIDTSNLSIFLYTIISGLLLAFLVQTLIRINKLKRACQSTIIDEIHFINTDAKGTPFSFFNTIFWNNNIDINTPTGKQIFRHEVAHVQEKHTYDKIFMNIVLILFWCNPVFWLIRKELNMIHEFIADRIAVENNDAADFAAMILQATYPQQQFNITNNFFYSPLKRRLIMLTKNNNPKINYVSRILVLPLAACVFFAFTLKMKKTGPVIHYNGKKITVVIDAGHGGDDKGISVDNINEKDLTLSIAKEIKELNRNENIEIILSREEDKSISVKDRVLFSKENNADLFVSVHLDGEENKNTNSGLEIFIPLNDNTYLKESKILGTNILESFKANYQLQTPGNLKQRSKGVWVLKANEYPAVLIEAGFLTTKKDLDYLLKRSNQKIIAKNILTGIEKYVQQAGSIKSENAILKNDTVPGNKVVVKAVASKSTDHSDQTDPPMESFNKSGDDLIVTKWKSTPMRDAAFAINAEVVIIKDRDIKDNKAIGLIIINGKVVDKSDLTDKLVTAKELKIYKSKSEEAIKLYGNAAKDGVMVFTEAYVTDYKQTNIENKKINELNTVGINIKNATFKNAAMADTMPENNDKVFTKAEVPPSFPGGDVAWGRYAKKIIEKRIDELVADNQSGTCRVRFIVDTKGNVSQVEALTMKGTKLAEIAVEGIRKGPRWTPATQNGQLVNAYKEMPLTFTIQDDTQAPGVAGLNPPRITLLGIRGGKILITQVEKINKIVLTNSNYRLESYTAYFTGAGFPTVIACGFTSESLKGCENFNKIISGTTVVFDNVIALRNDGVRIEVPGSSFTFIK